MELSARESEMGGGYGVVKEGEEGWCRHQGSGKSWKKTQATHTHTHIRTKGQSTCNTQSGRKWRHKT